MFNRLLCTFILILCAPSSTAQSLMPAPAAPIIGAKSYLVIDAHTGHELASLEPDYDGWTMRLKARSPAR